MTPLLRVLALWRSEALLLLTGRADVMQEFRNNRLTAFAGWTVASLIVGLNGVLLWQIFTG